MDTANFTTNLKYQLPQLRPDHNQIVSRLPDTPHYNKIIKDIEQRANDHLDHELAKLKRKAEQLDEEYCQVAEFINFFANWCVQSIHLAKQKYKAQANQDVIERTRIWQETAEYLVQDSEAIKEELAQYKAFVGELKRCKKLDRLKALVDKFEVNHE